MIVDIFRTLVAKSNDFVQIKPRYRYYISDTHKVCYACHSFIHVHLLSETSYFIHICYFQVAGSNPA